MLQVDRPEFPTQQKQTPRKIFLARECFHMVRKLPGKALYLSHFIKVAGLPS